MDLFRHAGAEHECTWRLRADPVQLIFEQSQTFRDLNEHHVSRCRGRLETGQQVHRRILQTILLQIGAGCLLGEPRIA